SRLTGHTRLLFVRLASMAHHVLIRRDSYVDTNALERSLADFLYSRAGFGSAEEPAAASPGPFLVQSMRCLAPRLVGVSAAPFAKLGRERMLLMCFGREDKTRSSTLSAGRS